MEQDKHERVEEFAAVYLPEEFFDTLGQNHVWPLTVFCVGFLAVTIAKELFQKVNHFLLKIFRLLACLPTEQVGYSEVRKLDCSYYEAKKRKRFGALSDYNILSNPRYQNAFKITAKWVREERKSQQIKGHRHLRSLRNFNREKSRGSFNGQEESKATSPIHQDHKRSNHGGIQMPKGSIQGQLDERPDSMTNHHTKL